jgi:branched-subunit amino acid aminotransferase/4-amino-4-deoxychorismate lyase
MAWSARDYDPLAGYKTLNYWERRIAYEQAREAQSDEAVSRSGPGSMLPGTLWEGSRTNLFLVAKGTLFTAYCNGTIVPGIMRGLILEQAPVFGLRVLEVPLTEDLLETADEAFLTNSVRGMIPLARLFERTFEPVPGPATEHLWGKVSAWLHSGGTT